MCDLGFGVGDAFAELVVVVLGGAGGVGRSGGFAGVCAFLVRLPPMLNNFLKASSVVLVLELFLVMLLLLLLSVCSMWLYLDVSDVGELRDCSFKSSGGVLGLRFSPFCLREKGILAKKKKYCLLLIV